MKLSDLLNEKTSSDGNVPVFYSAYLPIKNFTSLEIIQHLKSLLTESLRNSKRLKDKQHLPNTIFETLKDTSEELEGYQGVAIFAEINGEVKKENLHIVGMSTEPQKEFYIGRTYDLDQLAWDQQNGHNALVLQLERDRCKLYSLENGSIELIKEFTNDYKERRDKEYMEKYSPMRGHNTYHGTGSNKLDKFIEKGNFEFLRETTEEIKDYLENSAETPYIIAFYSTNFSKQIDTFESQMRDYSPRPEVIKISKNLKDIEKIRTMAQEKIEEHRKESVAEELKNLNNNFHEFVTNWKPVLDQARLGRIDKLYIKPHTEKKGFILDKQMIYTHPVEDSKKTKNISPWLVNSVIENGGKIVLIKDDDLLGDAEVAAKLRYTSA